MRKFTSNPTNKEYRYGCSIDCSGTPLRVYERTLGSQGSWTSMEDYLQVGNALGYGENQMVNHGQDKVALMTSEAYPMGFERADSNGMPIQAELEPCLCIAFSAGVCGPSLEGCASPCEEMPRLLPPAAKWNVGVGADVLKIFADAKHGTWCGPGHPKKRVPDPGGGVKPIPPPIDALDSCCYNHDNCYEINNCTGCGWFSFQCCLCDGSLWKCAARVDCRRSPFPKSCMKLQVIIGLLPTVRGAACFLLAP